MLLSLSKYIKIYNIICSVAGTLVSIFLENPKERDFYTKVAAPLTATELKFMTTFDIGKDTGFVDLKEYIVLTIVRIGALPVLLRSHSCCVCSCVCG